MGSRNAKRVKNLHGMEQIALDIKPRRSDSFVYSQVDLDMTNLVKYIEKKKKAGEKITIFHAFVTAIGKVLYNREKLNNFVQNRHVFKHNDVVVGFVAKVAFEDHAEEMMIMVPIKEDDNIESVSKFIKDKVDGIRTKEFKKEGANDAIDVLGKLPNIIRVPLVGLLKWMDDKGLLPASLCKDNLYYSSTIVSNLGSIGSNSIHHNLTNFGTSSSLITMGEIADKEIITGDKKETRKICDWGVAFDERVADGFYLIKSLKMLQYIFDNPKMLEEDAGKKIEMPKKETKK